MHNVRLFFAVAPFGTRASSGDINLENVLLREDGDSDTNSLRHESTVWTVKTYFIKLLLKMWLKFENIKKM